MLRGGGGRSTDRRCHSSAAGVVETAAWAGRSWVPVDGGSRQAGGGGFKGAYSSRVLEGRLEERLLFLKNRLVKRRTVNLSYAKLVLANTTP